MRILGILAGVVNMVCMTAAFFAGDFQTFLIGWAGAAFSAYAILYTLEERQDMGETPVGYRSLAMRLRYDLKNEGFTPGQRLPPVRELATRYETTRTTVSRALKILADENLIESVKGRGTYVVGGAREDRPKDRIAWEILDQLKDKQPGFRVPSSAEIMRRYGVSHPTVRRIHRELTDKGHIRRTPTGGYEKA